jgi:phytoene dehydrogenase-like protein
MALPIFCVYLALDIDLSERVPDTNYWYYTSFDIEGMYQECYKGRIPTDLGLFITMASVKDPHTERIAPDGYSSLEIMSWVPPDYRLWGSIDEGPASGEKYHGKAEYRAFKDELTDAMVAGAEEAIPDIRDHIIWKEAATPITQERYTLSTGGTSYGLEIATDQFGPNRPTPKTEIDGLFLAGASTIFGHGIVGAMRGGVGCASAVLNRDLMAEVSGGSVFGDPSKLTAGGPDWDPWEACR